MMGIMKAFQQVVVCPCPGAIYMFEILKKCKISIPAQDQLSGVLQDRWSSGYIYNIPTKNTSLLANFRHKNTSLLATFRHKNTSLLATFRHKNTSLLATFRHKNTSLLATYRHKNTKTCIMWLTFSNHYTSLCWFPALQWRYQMSFNKMEPILCRRLLMTSWFEM